MSAAPDGLHVWNGQPTGPLGILLLNPNNSGLPLITDQNEAVGTTIGKVTAYSGNPSDTFTYSKVADPDQKFSLVGNLLKVSGTFNYNQAQAHSVTLRATNQYNLSIDATFSVAVDASVDNGSVTNVAVSCEELEGSSVGAEITVAVNHVIGIPSISTRGEVDSLLLSGQRHVITIGNASGSATMQPMDVLPPQLESLNGEYVINAVTVQQEHHVTMSSPKFPERVTVPHLMVNAMQPESQWGFSFMFDMTGIVESSHVNLESSYAVISIYPLGIGAQLDGLMQQHNVTLLALTGSANAGQPTVSVGT